MARKTTTCKQAAKKPTAKKTTRKTTAQKPTAKKPVAKKQVTKKQAAKKPATTRNSRKKADRDVEKTYSHKAFVSKLRRLADSIEKGKNFKIMVAGENIYIPDDAVFNIEHEREKGDQELEFQIKWKKAA